MKTKYFIICLLLISGCNSNTESNHFVEWSKNLTIYEIMPRQYSDSGNFNGITNDLNRIRSLFFNTICLLPVLDRDEANNPFNPNSPFAIKDFLQLDEKLGTAQEFRQLIDSSHSKGIKVLMEWNLNITGPHHEWRSKFPHYYHSNEKMINNTYNQDYIQLNIENEDVQKKLLDAITQFIKSYSIDGLVLFDQDLAPKSFTQKVLNSLRSIKPLLLINHSASIIEGFDYNMNTYFYSKLKRMYDGGIEVSDMSSYLDTLIKYRGINYVHDYFLNEKYGSDVNVFYNAYKYFHSLAFMLPGIQWVLNGQEDPQFDRISIFSPKPIERKYNYNFDFYRSLNYQKEKNPALWNNHLLIKPRLISNSHQVLAMERISDTYCIVGLFNLTNAEVNFQIDKDYFYFYEIFNKVPVNFTKNTNLKLGPYQSIIFSNVP